MEVEIENNENMQQHIENTVEISDQQSHEMKLMLEELNELRAENVFRRAGGCESEAYIFLP